MKLSVTYIVSTVSSSLFVFKTMKILVFVLMVIVSRMQRKNATRLHNTLLSMFHGLISEPHANCYRRLVNCR